VAPALVALTLYSLLPLVRNTYAGLENVDNAIIDSGRGMGMTPAQIFFQIELPLAFPVIMAGVRNAGVALVGIGTVATVIGAGGLGDFVIQGIVNTSIDQILLGALPAIALAMVLDALLRFVEGLLTSPGIRHVQNT
jgi:osmoprotectant transport system permease protein